MDEPIVKALSEAFVQTLNTNPAVIKQAEALLKEYTKQPGFAIAALKVVSLDSPVEIRQAAAVNFKNFVKFHWDPVEDAEIHIAEAEKEQIKGLITSLMLSTPGPVRAQLSEALTIIGQHDFPAKWMSLLPELLERLKNGSLLIVEGILETANSIFKRYRNQIMSNDLSRELEYAQQLVKPLLETLQKLVKELENPEQGFNVKQALDSIRLLLRVFFSLNSPGLTEDFEDTLGAWMEEFHKLLAYQNTSLAPSKSSDKPSPVDAVKAAVCQNINLLVNRDEEEFAKFLQILVQDVWTQLMTVTADSNQDVLAMSAIQFLTTVSSSSRNSNLFQSEDALRQICEKIVIPNLRLNDDLEEMFEMNYVEYVRRDTEGSDFDTRRRAATELVKALNTQFEAEVTKLFTAYVKQLLAEAGASKANWKAKDAAMYLVTALAVRGKTAGEGATATNQLFDVADFFQGQVVPELSTGSEGQTILQADALKFVTIFRSKLPKASLLTIFPQIISLLKSESNVVHSYAAILIERLLVLKENGQPKFAVQDLTPLLQQLLENLFAVFALPDSAENEYAMKCVMRVISFVGQQIAAVAPQCLEQLSKLLLAVCKNPTVPGFNHFLFESVAALINNSVADAKTVETLESMLFPAFQTVLTEDVQEFHPYVFQIFSQLIELRPKPLPSIYMQMLRPFLSPVLWERPGNVPALVRLTRAYLSKAAEEIVQTGILTAILGTFQKLVAGKLHDHEGFKLLQSIIEHIPNTALASYLPEVWRILFQRLQAARTKKYTVGLLTFLAWLVCKQGAASVESSVDSVQAGLFRMLLEHVWFPSMGSIKAHDQEKLLFIATTQVLCEAPAMQTADSATLWGNLLQLLLAQMDNRAPTTEVAQEDEDEEAGAAGYSAAYARLHNAAFIEPDPFPSIQDTSKYLAESIGRFSQAHPGRVNQLVQSHVPPEGQLQLQQYCQRVGVSIA